MTTVQPPTERRLLATARAAALWARDTGLGGFGFALVLLVAIAGWSASFLGLHGFGVQHMGFSNNAGWLVPLTFDGAPAGLSIVVMRASTHGRSALQWRLLIILFTALSSWINYQHIDDSLGRYVASFMPPSAVILFEGLMSEARHAAQRRGGHVMARIHPLRWFFDRTGTLDLYRRHILGLPLPDAMQSAIEAPVMAATGATQSALPAATVAPQAAAINTPQGAMQTAIVAPPQVQQSAMAAATNGAPVSLVKRPQGAPAVAPVAPPSTPPKRPATVTTSAPKAPRKAATKRPQGTVRSAARDAIEALYMELGRRPLESEMVAALIKAKLPKSRQFANARRLELEHDNPALAALGSQNVRALTAP